MAPELELPGPLVDAKWLAANLDHPDLVVADVRWSLTGPDAGRAAYEEGHIPGAVFVDLDAELAATPSDPGKGGRHPLPASAAFAAAMSGKGIGDNHVVVAYDDSGGSTAARLWWMLDALGHPAAVLDGGIAAWDGFIQTEAPDRPLAMFSEKPWPAKAVADADAVAEAAEKGVPLIDARTPERFRGEQEPVDARAGHIPGAVNVPWAENLTDERRFQPPRTLRDRYAAVGVDPSGTDDGEAPIVYCGSGVTACHDVLALRAAGVGPVRLYVGSWSEWSADPDRPIATGNEETPQP
ncbi:MAG: sulfurtransferase [Actinobacteria bacterium]|nr:sulfurtransferase [Actinomycetota bacterium]